jgi:hypothetical protein
MEREQLLEKIFVTIIADIEDYYDTFKKPVVMSTVRNRPARDLKKADIKMLEAVRMLKKRNRIHMFVNEAMTRFLLPIEAWNAMNDAQKLEIRNLVTVKEKDLPEEIPEGRVSTFFTNKESKHAF